MAQNTAHPCRRRPTIFPYVNGAANGMSRIAASSRRLLIPVGFSKGWDELALKNPPPLVPSCLMATWDATGPPGIIWWAPSSVCTS